MISNPVPIPNAAALTCQNLFTSEYFSDQDTSKGSLFSGSRETRSVGKGVRSRMVESSEPQTEEFRLFQSASEGYPQDLGGSDLPECIAMSIGFGIEMNPEPSRPKVSDVSAVSEAGFEDFRISALRTPKPISETSGLSFHPKVPPALQEPTDQSASSVSLQSARSTNLTNQKPFNSFARPKAAAVRTDLAFAGLENPQPVSKQTSQGHRLFTEPAPCGNSRPKIDSSSFFFDQQYSSVLSGDISVDLLKEINQII